MATVNGLYDGCDIREALFVSDIDSLMRELDAV